MAGKLLYCPKLDLRAAFPFHLSQASRDFLVQTLCALGTTDLAQLYVGRVIGGFGVGLISAVVPTYIGEIANKEIRGRCIGW